MVNTPIPHSLKSEAKKAAKILREFTVSSSKIGPDKLIPVDILSKAKGLAILTVCRVGFLVTARGGSGIVIAKINDDFDCTEWTAPSAIGIAGLGGGFEVGAEVTDFVILLNNRSAVDAFSKGGNLTLGGNFSIAAGPLGRNLEADVAVRSTAAIYTYSKTRGIFAGISVEGSALIERKDANKKFYGRDIRAYEILSGDIPPPPECEALYEVLDAHRIRAEKLVEESARKKAHKHSQSPSAFSSERKFSFKSKEDKTSPKIHSKTERTTVQNVTTKQSGMMVTRTFTTHTTRTVTGSHNTDANILIPGHVKARVIFPYQAQLPCDLTLKKDDEILVLTRTKNQNDWWEGVVNGKTGIFPSNYVKVV